MMDKLVSIIIPVYNCEKVLYNCLESIRKQTFTNLEIIIVNDGSTDKSLDVALHQEKLDKRIKIINKKNGGVSNARNFGMKMAQGELIAFIDADDYIAFNYIEELYNTLWKYNADICCCDYTVEYAKKIPEYKFIREQDTSSSKTESFSLYSGYNYMNEKYRLDSVWGVIFKSTLIKNLKFATDLFVGEDTLFFAQAASKSNKIAHIDKKLYHYVIYDNSASHGTFDEKKYTETIAWERICECFNNIPNAYNSAKCGYAVRCRKMIINYYENNLFKNNYYRRVKQIYCNNLKYLLKSSDITLVKKIASIGFIILPKLYIKIKKKEKNENRNSNNSR